MSYRTAITGKQIRDGSICRVDLNTTDVGEAVITKSVAGSNILLSSTGTDAGTGDVTINLNTSITNIDSIETEGEIRILATETLRLQSNGVGVEVSGTPNDGRLAFSLPNAVDTPIEFITMERIDDDYMLKCSRPNCVIKDFRYIDSANNTPLTLRSNNLLVLTNEIGTTFNTKVSVYSDTFGDPIHNGNIVLQTGGTHTSRIIFESGDLQQWYMKRMDGDDDTAYLGSLQLNCVIGNPTLHPDFNTPIGTTFLCGGGYADAAKGAFIEVQANYLHNGEDNLNGNIAIVCGDQVENDLDKSGVLNISQKWDGVRKDSYTFAPNEMVMRLGSVGKSLTTFINTQTTSDTGIDCYYASFLHLGTDDANMYFTVNIIAREVGINVRKGMVGQMRFGAERTMIGGNAAIIPGMIKEFMPYNGASYDVTADISGNAVRFVVYGEAGKTVDWVLKIDVCSWR